MLIGREMLKENFHKQLVENRIGSLIKEQKTSFAKSIGKTILLLNAVEEIFRVLKKVGIQAILLKGPVLAETVYPHFSLRPFSDIDLLIREEDWGKFKDTLQMLGYQLKEHNMENIPSKLIEFQVASHIHLVKDGVVVDVHFDPLQLGLKMRTLDELWASAAQIVIGEERVLTLSPEYQLFHLCVHANRHGYRKFIWLQDIYFLLKEKGNEINWLKLQKIARTESLETSVYFTLRLVEEIFGLNLGQNINLFKPSFLSKWAWQKTWPWEKVKNFQGVCDGSLVFSDRDIFSTRFFLNFLLTRRCRDKMFYFVRKVLPPLDYLRERYGKLETKKYSYFAYLALRYKTFIKNLLNFKRE